MQLVKPFGFNRFKPVTQHGVIHGIEKRFHFGPLPNICLTHWVSESCEGAELSQQWQFVFAVEVI